MSRIVTSAENPEYKRLKALASNRKHADTQGMALLDGIHLATACLEAEVQISEIILSSSGAKDPQIVKFLSRVPAVPIFQLAPGLFRTLSTVDSPTGILLVVAIPIGENLDDRMTLDAVALDGVQDAGNVGTILRTAAAAGVRNVVLGIGCAGAWTPKVLRAAQGAHFCLNIYEHVDLTFWLPKQSLSIIGAAAAATTSIFDSDLRQPVIWVFGSEGQGLSSGVEAVLSRQVLIPMKHRIDSINVSAAAAVCLFEAVRQRQHI